MEQTTRPSLTLNALREQALRIATPSWIDEHCEVRTFNTMRRATVASLPDGSLSFTLAVCVDDDSDRGPAVGVIAEIIGPGGQLLSHEACWGIEEPDTYYGLEVQAYLNHLAAVAAECIKEAADVRCIRAQLHNRAEAIAAALQALG